MKSKLVSIVLVLIIGWMMSCRVMPSLAPALETPSANASTPTIEVLLTPSLNELGNECMVFNLTPEECTNAGTHTYSTSTQILFDQSGQTCTIDNSDITITIEFLTNETLSYSDSFDVEMAFTRTDANRFEGGYTQADGKFEWKDTIVFTANGFTLEAKSYNLEENEHLCTFIWEQEIIK